MSLLNIDVSLEGFDEFENHLVELAEGQFIESGFRALVERFRNQAILDNPVGDERDEHRGLMRRSWQKPVYTIGNTQMSAKVENSVEYGMAENYGHYQEPGTYVPAINATLVHFWVPGTYGLETALDKVTDEWESIVSPEVLRVWNSIRTDYYDKPFGEIEDE